MTDQPMRDALLNCPFCGSDQVSRSVGQTGDGKPWHYIECEKCAANAEPDAWNRRAYQAGAASRDGALRDALAQSITAIDDWLNIDASDFCDESRVAEAWKRINDAGGTIAYIADIQKANRAALAATKE